MHFCATEGTEIHCTSKSTCFIIPHSTTSLYNVGDYYKGNYTSGVDVPAAVDVFYVLSFDDILRSYGMFSSTVFSELTVVL